MIHSRFQSSFFFMPTKCETDSVRNPGLTGIIQSMIFDLSFFIFLRFFRWWWWMSFKEKKGEEGKREKKKERSVTGVS